MEECKPGSASLRGSLTLSLLIMLSMFSRRLCSVCMTTHPHTNTCITHTCTRFPAQRSRVHLLDTESFDTTFGPKSQRKRPRVSAADIEVGLLGPSNRSCVHAPACVQSLNVSCVYTYMYMYVTVRVSLRGRRLIHDCQGSLGGRGLIRSSCYCGGWGL